MTPRVSGYAIDSVKRFSKQETSCDAWRTSLISNPRNFFKMFLLVMRIANMYHKTESVKQFWKWKKLHFVYQASSFSDLHCLNKLTSQSHGNVNMYFMSQLIEQFRRRFLNVYRVYCYGCHLGFWNDLKMNKLWPLPLPDYFFVHGCIRENSMYLVDTNFW